MSKETTETTTTEEFEPYIYCRKIRKHTYIFVWTRTTYQSLLRELGRQALASDNDLNFNDVADITYCIKQILGITNDQV